MGTRGAARSHVVVRMVVAAACALLVTGCQVRVATEIEVAIDGSGSASMRIVVDEELRETVEEAGVDLLAGLEEAAAGATWDARALDDVDGGLGVELTTDFATPAELTQRIEALSAGLTVDDGALLRDVTLEVAEDGSYAFSARAGIDPPRIVGSLPTGDDVGVTFDGDDLGAAMAEAGDELARADLRVTFPTVPTTTDEDATVELRTVTWSLPVDRLAAVNASAPPVPATTSYVLVGAAGLAGLVLGLFAVRAFRR